MNAGALHFGGQKTAPDSKLAPELAAQDPRHQEMMFERWLLRVWLKSDKALACGGDYRHLDLATLRAQFRAQYSPAVWRQMDTGGATLEEASLEQEMLFGSPAVLMLVERFRAQPTQLVKTKWIAPGDVLVTLLHWAAQEFGRTVKTFVTDGAWAHVIAVTGVDSDTGWFQIYDPWSEQVGKARSLLCEENNAAGVAATVDAARSDRWLITPTELSRVLVASIVDHGSFLMWLSRLTAAAARGSSAPLPLGQSVQPEGLSLDRFGPELIHQALGDTPLHALGSPRPPTRPGEAAFVRGGQAQDAKIYPLAEQEYRTAASTGDDDIRAMAGYDLGLLLGNRLKDWERADEAFERVVALQHRGRSPLGAWELGLSRAINGIPGQRGAAARPYFQLAADSGHPQVCGKAAYMLALGLNGPDEGDRRAQYLRRALEGDPETTDERTRSGAAKELGDLFMKECKYAQALSMYERAWGIAGAALPDTAAAAAAGMQAARLFLGGGGQRLG